MERTPNGQVSQEDKRRVIARDKRQCQVCNRYFGEHRPLDVVIKNPDKPMSGDENLITTCFSCKEEFQTEWDGRTVFH